MLSQNEYDLLVKKINQLKKCTLKQALEIVHKDFVHDDPMTSAYKRLNKDCITPTRKILPDDALSQRERKLGFKVNTEDRSQQGESTRGRSSVK